MMGNLSHTRAQIPSDNQEPQAKPYTDSSLFATRLQVKQPGEDFYYDIDPTSNIVPDIKNQSQGRFLTTLANTGDESIYLKGVDIFIFNSTNKIVTDNRMKYIFFKELELGRNSSMTVEFERNINFPFLNDFFTVFYSIVYTASSNRSLDLFLSPGYNFTLHAIEPEAQPPEFVGAFWGG